MARLGEKAGHNQNTQVDASTQEGHIRVPADGFIANAEILRDGQDLILRHPDGDTFTIENYFSAMPAPTLVNDAGAGLSPSMVRSFVQPADQAQRYAQAGMNENDESAVGLVTEVQGSATITRGDGTVEKIVPGMAVFAGDVVETDQEGAVNIVFIDETSFAVSNNARLSIDEYVFDPASGSGTQSFSVLRGMFVFVSGMIGREDPDDVEISTPIGNIGIRGTTIAGNVDSGEITVVEGAIVLRTMAGQETTLATPFETARFNAGGSIEHLGVQDGAAIAAQFNTMHAVAGSFFAGIGVQGQAAGQAPEQTQTQSPTNAPVETPIEVAPEIVPPGGYNETSFDGGQDAGFGQAGGGSNTAPVNTSPAPAQTAPSDFGGSAGGASTAPVPGPLDGAQYNPPPVVTAPGNNTTPPTTSPGTPGGGVVPADMTYTITATGNYNGGAGNDIFELMYANFGTIDGGGGHDRVILMPGLLISGYHFAGTSLTGVEEVNAANGSNEIITVAYQSAMTAQSNGQQLSFVLDAPDQLNISFDATFRVTAIENGVVSFGDGTNTVRVEIADMANVNVSGASYLTAGTTMADGTVFVGYREFGEMEFRDANNDVLIHNGPQMDNVHVGGTTALSVTMWSSGHYYAGGGASDAVNLMTNDVTGSHFDGGAGFDRMFLDMNGSMDLSVLGTAGLQNFEEITFNAAATQTVRLSLNQILQLLEQSDSSNQLYISDGGNVGAKTLEVTGGDLAAAADSVSTVGTFTEYAFDVAGTIHTLMVSENIAVTAV